MLIKWNMRGIDILLCIGLGGFFSLGLALVLYPYLTLLDIETVTKVSGIYENPIYLTFHWITDDEIQVGKLITLDVRVSGLPYTRNMTLKNIEISIPEKYVNYWEDKTDIRQNQFLQSDFVVLRPDWNANVFKSSQINLRFVVPDNIPMMFCDYNRNDPCTDIPNIIHPAPYDLANRIDTNRIVISLSLLTASLSMIVIWTRLRGTNDNPQKQQTKT